jgi:hypothetical protein
MPIPYLLELAAKAPLFSMLLLVHELLEELHILTHMNAINKAVMHMDRDRHCSYSIRFRHFTKGYFGNAVLGGISSGMGKRGKF